MKLFIIPTLLFIVTVTHLPNLSFGIKCWKCNKIIGVQQCSKPLSLSEKNCTSSHKMCVHVEYLKNNGLHYVNCDIYDDDDFKEEIQCTTDSVYDQSGKVNLRRCTCGTDLCNNPNKERIQCDSCFGNRKGINRDEPFYGPYPINTAVTDFECKKDEKPEAIYCPLDAPECMIKRDKKHKKIGCGKHEIPEGQTSDCYYSSEVAECYCNTNRCNTDSLITWTWTTDNSANTEQEDVSGNGNTGQEDFSGNGNTEQDKCSSSSMDLSQILIIVIVVLLVVILAQCIVVTSVICRRKNNRNRSDIISDNRSN